MGYIDRNLTEGEVVIYRANISWWVFFRAIVIFGFLIWLSSKIHAIVVFLVIVSVIIVVLRIILAIVTTEFAITNRRLIAKRGLINRQTMEILLEKVESIKITQPLDGRIFKFGTVTVIGTGGSVEHFHSISYPNELQKQVHQQLSNH